MLSDLEEREGEQYMKGSDRMKEAHGIAHPTTSFGRMPYVPHFVLGVPHMRLIAWLRIDQLQDAPSATGYASTR